MSKQGLPLDDYNAGSEILQMHPELVAGHQGFLLPLSLLNRLPAVAGRGGWWLAALVPRRETMEV